MKYKFNLNHNIKVELTDLGYQLMCKSENDLMFFYPSYVPKTIDDYKSKADSEGYYEFQAWEFIGLFGSVTHMGMTHYFFTDIIIDSNDLIQI